MYKADTPSEDQSVKGHNSAVDEAVRKEKRELGGKFSKLQAIANPAHGPGFMDQAS